MSTYLFREKKDEHVHLSVSLSSSMGFSGWATQWKVGDDMDLGYNLIVLWPIMNLSFLGAATVSYLGFFFL